jgi:predicted nucleic acid-binding protein
MTYSSSLADDSSSLILDTSVLINLHASTHGRRILTSLPHNVLVPEIVAAELDHETSKINGGHQFVRELAS